MKAWHFLPADRRLQYGDRRLVVVGETLRHDGPLVLCESGLHASERLIDALQYAPGPVICRVRLGGDIVRGDDKAVATERTVLAMIDGTTILRAFARRCALDVAHLRAMPDIVRRYMETGDESIRVAARAAARGAARDAAWVAARAAGAAAAALAYAGDTALAAASGAARDAAGAAAWDARDAAWDAAWDDARDAQNTTLTEMVEAAMAVEGMTP